MIFGQDSIRTSNAAKIDDLKSDILPEGWYNSGSKPANYKMSVDNNGGQDNETVFSIKSMEKDMESSGTLVQKLLPNKYWEKRIKVTGYIKTNDVLDHADISLHVFNFKPTTPVIKINFDTREIKETKDWKRFEIILEVPKTINRIEFDVSLIGTGQIWFKKINNEVLESNLPSSDKRNDVQIENQRRRNHQKDK